MNARSVVTSSLIAGALMGVLSGIPVVAMVNCFLCGWIWGGGIFAVWLYRKNTGGQLVELMPALLVGAAAGLVAAAISSIMSLLFGSAAAATALLSELPNAGELLGPQLAQNGVSAFVAFLFNAFTFPIFGAIGGFLGREIFKR